MKKQLTASEMVKKRNAMPQYGPEWRKKITSEAGKASAAAKKLKKGITQKGK